MSALAKVQHAQRFWQGALLRVCSYRIVEASPEDLTVVL
jgi:hypothetical protein